MIKSLTSLFKKKEVKRSGAGSVALTEQQWEMVLTALENDLLYAMKLNTTQAVTSAIFIKDTLNCIDEQLKRGFKTQ